MAIMSSIIFVTSLNGNLGVFFENVKFVFSHFRLRYRVINYEFLHDRCAYYIFFNYQICIDLVAFCQGHESSIEMRISAGPQVQKAQIWSVLTILQ